MSPSRDSVLAAGEPAPVSVHNKDGASPFLIVADHAGNAVPRCLGGLGLADADRARHIAWDIGIGGVCRALADVLDATLIRQHYSRLVIDCNRPPGSATSIPEISDDTPIPGNGALTQAMKDARRLAIFRPYHDCIAAELDRRRDTGRPAILLAMHSFTPVFKSEARPWHAGLLYHRDRRLAQILAPLLAREPGLLIGDNEPYSVGDDTDYTIPMHGEARGLHHIAIEIRQDLIADDDGQRRWALLLARVLAAALAELRGAGGAG